MTQTANANHSTVEQALKRILNKAQSIREQYPDDEHWYGVEYEVNAVGKITNDSPARKQFKGVAERIEIQLRPVRRRKAVTGQSTPELEYKWKSVQNEKGQSNEEKEQNEKKNRVSNDFLDKFSSEMKKASQAKGIQILNAGQGRFPTWKFAIKNEFASPSTTSPQASPHSNKHSRASIPSKAEPDQNQRAKPAPSSAPKRTAPQRGDQAPNSAPQKRARFDTSGKNSFPRFEDPVVDLPDALADALPDTPTDQPGEPANARVGTVASRGARSGSELLGDGDVAELAEIAELALL